MHANFATALWKMDGWGMLKGAAARFCAFIRSYVYLVWVLNMYRPSGPFTVGASPVSMTWSVMSHFSIFYKV